MAATRPPRPAHPPDGAGQRHSGARRGTRSFARRAPGAHRGRRGAPRRRADAQRSRVALLMANASATAKPSFKSVRAGSPAPIRPSRTSSTKRCRTRVRALPTARDRCRSFPRRQRSRRGLNSPRAGPSTSSRAAALRVDRAASTARRTSIRRPRLWAARKRGEPPSATTTSESRIR